MSFIVESTQKAKGLYVVSPTGSLDSNTYQIFEQKVDAVLQESPNMIVFDFENLDYLSSAGLRVIFKTRSTLKQHGGKVTFLNLKPQIKKVFEIVNAIPSMKIFTSIEELDGYLDAIQKQVTEGEQ